MLSLVANMLTEPPRSIRSEDEGRPDGRRGDDHARAREGSRSTIPVDGRRRQRARAVRVAIDRRRTRAHHTAPRDEDDPAYAATTRVPTTVSVEPPPERPAGLANARRARRRRALRSRLRSCSSVRSPRGLRREDATGLARLRRPRHAIRTRPLSTVPQAEAAYKDAMSLWHDGAPPRRAQRSRARSSSIRRSPPRTSSSRSRSVAERSGGRAGVVPERIRASSHAATARRARSSKRASHTSAPKPDRRGMGDADDSVVFEFPRDPELQYYLGRARNSKAMTRRAKIAFEAAVRLDDGFVPALAAMANARRTSANIARGARHDRALLQAIAGGDDVRHRRATSCSSRRANASARTRKRAHGALEPSRPSRSRRLARALHADGAPRPSVEEVLSRRWSLVPARSEEAGRGCGIGRSLAVLDGDFVHAEELAHEYDAALPSPPTRYDHAKPARLRVNLLMETDRMKDAAKAARGFLDRMAAWPTYPFAPDPSIDFYEPHLPSGRDDEARARRQARRMDRAGDSDARAKGEAHAIRGSLGEVYGASPRHGKRPPRPSSTRLATSAAARDRRALRRFHARQGLRAQVEMGRAIPDSSASSRACETSTT